MAKKVLSTITGALKTGKANAQYHDEIYDQFVNGQESLIYGGLEVLIEMGIVIEENHRLYLPDPLKTKEE